jgi:hypothetical protein
LNGLRSSHIGNQFTGDVEPNENRPHVEEVISLNG